MVIKRHSYKKNYNIKNKRKSKINGGRPPIEDNDQCRVIATLSRENGHRSLVISVAFHPKLPLLATASVEDTAKLWRFSADGSTTTCVATLEEEHGHSNDVISVAFHPKLPLLATGSKDDTAKLWSFNPDGSEDNNMSATCVATLGRENHGHSYYVTSVAFHPELPLIATGCTDYTAELWSFNPNGLEIGNMSATCVETLGGWGLPDTHRDWVNSVAFHPVLPLLATGSHDRTAKLWRFDSDGLAEDNMSATCVATLEGDSGHSDIVNSVAFHPTLPLLATGSDDSSAKLWRFDPDGSARDNMSATCVATLIGHDIYVVISVAFHPLLPLLATCSADGTAKLWRFNPHGSARDNMSATCVDTLRGHSNIVTSVAFHPKLSLLATGSFDNTAKLWRCKILISHYNDFILYRKKINISEDICNSLCYLCNFNLCKKNSSNDKNSNGYVVKLTNGDLTNDIHVHYNCLHFQLTTNKTEIDDIPISSDTIQRILNIDGKEDALIGTDFYNDAYTDEEGDTFYSANSNRDNLDNEDVFYSAKSYIA
jgi:WD40 repeat protein